MLYGAFNGDLDKGIMYKKSRKAIPVGVAELHDRVLCFKGKLRDARLTIQQCEGEIVPLGIWEVPDDFVERLKKYDEKYDVDYVDKRVFETVNVEVEYFGDEYEFGRTINGVVKNENVLISYIDREKRYGLPTLEYTHNIYAGYDYFNSFVGGSSKEVPNTTTHWKVGGFHAEIQTELVLNKDFILEAKHRSAHRWK